MDSAPKPEEPIENIDEEEEQESEEEEVLGNEKEKAILNERMLAAAKKNDIEEVEKCLKKRADIGFEGKSGSMQNRTQRRSGTR